MSFNKNRFYTYSSKSQMKLCFVLKKRKNFRKINKLKIRDKFLRDRIGILIWYKISVGILLCGITDWSINMIRFEKIDEIRRTWKI